jgi:hypothetical protein
MIEERRAHWKRIAASFLAGALVAFTPFFASAEGEETGACSACDARHQRLVRQTVIASDSAPAVIMALPCLQNPPIQADQDDPAAGVTTPAFCPRVALEPARPESP